MRRKRRKAYKKWKILNSTSCASRSPSHVCQQDLKDVEKEVKRDSTEAVLHQMGALGESKEDGGEHMSASMSGKNSSLFLTDEKHPASDSRLHKRVETDDPPLAISQQPKKFLPVALFNDSKGSLPGKITLPEFPNTRETSKPEKDKFVTEVKCGNFNVQVEIKENKVCKTGAQFPTKKRCPTCHQRLPVRHVRRCFISRSCFPKYNNMLAEESQKSSKSKGEIIRTVSPLLKVSIVGKEIKVKYVSKKRNIVVNITHPIRMKITKHRNISSSLNTDEPSDSSLQPGNKHPEKRALENKHQIADCLHICPDIFTIQENSDTHAVSLNSTPKREKNKSNIPSSASDDSAICPQKVFQITQNIPQKKNFSAENPLLKSFPPTTCDILKLTNLSDTDLSTLSFEDPNDVDVKRKTNFDVAENITSDSHLQQNTKGANHLLNITPAIVHVQGGSHSDFCSLSSLSMQLTGEKSAIIDCKGGKTPPAEDCENSNFVSFPSSQNVLKPSTSFSPSHWSTRNTQPQKIPGNIFSFNHYAEFVIDCEQNRDDMTGRDINKAFSHSDSYMNTQQLERQICADTLSPPHSSRNSSAERDETEPQENHPSVASPSQTKGPAMMGEFRQTLITENDKDSIVGSNCPTGNSYEIPSSLGNGKKDKIQTIAMVKNACHRDSGDLASENRKEVSFQMDFPLDTTESSCTGCATDKLFPTEQTLTSDADHYGNQNEKSLRLASFLQEPAEYKRTESRKPNSEGDGNQYDSKENHYHQVDILQSPQKQNALKDQNLETIALRKLSQELALRGGRASDGSQEEAIEQWARRRQQYRDGKRCSSTGGSSFASNVTEGSFTSDDGRSMDCGFRIDIEEKGFYTESFHAAAWVFQGDDGDPEDSPRCLSKKPRPVAVRERTVRLFKGTGDYPWGFRIQFSKPIMVTEVDTNSAAEEAGLQIGDVVLSVNGTEVTSAEHAEAVHLARKGPDILTLVVGSDISRCPNNPWPTCRGYLHKRTHSSFMKGWRKRWFVLKHGGYLHYYKHKKDEGKLPPLEAINLEGAEVAVDNTLGKPFVFSCVPQCGNRMFFFCATSNQEMKRWLEAMDEAAHPIHQNHVWEDVTLHNSSLPPLAIKNPECLGLLHLLDRSTDEWVQRYCILKDGCLYFYASIRSTQASGGLYLQGYRVSEQTHNYKQSVIELKPPSEEFKTFYLCADNTTENQRWVTALTASIKKWLPLQQAIQDFMNRPLEETKM